MEPDLSPDGRRAVERLAAAPGPRIERAEIEGRRVWIKRGGQNQETRWHRLQRLVAALAPHPMLRVTVDTGGPASLDRERARIESFAAAGFLVPPVVLATGSALVLGDLGDDLGRLQKRDRAAFLALLPTIGETLGRVHAAGLVHGRPSRRDLVHRAGAIGFLDFEEDPSSVMPVPVAQARDVWLLFIDLARSGLEAADLEACWSGYRPHLDARRRQALAGPVRFVGGAGRALMPLVGRFAGRDLKAPIGAARFLDTALDRQG